MFHQKLTILEEKRAGFQPLPSGESPFASSSMFKVQDPDSKPKAKPCDRHFRTNPGLSILKASARVKTPSKTISLGTGRPASEFYPWESIDIHGKTGSMSCTTGESAYDFAMAMGYGYAAGSPQLLRFVTEHIELIHNPPYRDWECCLTSGTTAAIDIAFRIFCVRGDSILVEDRTYSGTMDIAKAHGLKLVGVRMDDFGLVPEDLDRKLRTWNGSDKPRVLYMIPSGHNPTATTQSTERRKAIYEVAERHDLFIIEDDPYYFLQLGKGDFSDAPDEYLSRLPVSYLSLDVSGRVLRLDSTSKILAPGLRCGWLTACSQAVERILAYTEISTVEPSGVSQVMLYKLLEECWGHEGFINWLSRLSHRYTQRRNVLLGACERHLSDVCQWSIPTEGMFLWIKLDVSDPDIEDEIYVKSKENGVLVSKGSWFSVSEDTDGVHFRFTFAAAAQDDLDEAVSRFGDIVRNCLRRTT
ncbi:uncharacterized protein K452DRAFT_235154 [Aplosporella prunicola CBS 121167]|uniref:Aminotransferase class I/classII large domain-containing protein n=1 Tax=Aplosporella prunicola CBS 121167 TaxID=1176127 RepID=A0A6A6B5V2_9PEZI|nr:uncharacterized protein K452DRAFT_235154 [Aplosporella prunicola CBS 121167]KAF2138151.1 hypothetical protein K452DRAFT_235154 [Aplosporella prunicola CBS 121167]